MNRNKTIYLSFPITGIPNGNKDAAHAAEIFYKDEGYNVVNPLNAGNLVENIVNKTLQERHFMGIDVMLLSQCDMMIILPGWELSKGCRFELAFARMYGLPVFKAYSHELIDLKPSFVFETSDKTEYSECEIKLQKP